MISMSSENCSENLCSYTVLEGHFSPLGTEAIFVSLKMKEAHTRCGLPNIVYEVTDRRLGLISSKRQVSLAWSNFTAKLSTARQFPQFRSPVFQHWASYFFTCVTTTCSNKSAFKCMLEEAVCQNSGIKCSPQ